MAFIDPDVFGRPGEGVHFRVLGVAVVDLALTAVAAAWIARWRGWGFWATFAALIAVGEVVHAAVGVRTQFIEQASKIF